MAKSKGRPAPQFIDVVNAHLPNDQTARMRADTLRGDWRPAKKADREAAIEAGSVEPPAKRTTAKKAASSDTATAGANDTEKEQ